MWHTMQSHWLTVRFAGVVLVDALCDHAFLNSATTLRRVSPFPARDPALIASVPSWQFAHTRAGPPQFALPLPWHVIVVQDSPVAVYVPAIFFPEPAVTCTVPSRCEPPAIRV